MPVVGIPLDEFFTCLGTELPTEQLIDELHRFGCSVEGRVTVERYRCVACGGLSEAPVGEPAPPLCDRCGAPLRSQAAEPVARVETLKMELLAVRPDVFDPAGLARALRGFLGLETGAPHYPVKDGAYRVAVDAALEGPRVRRPRIACAVVRGVRFSDASLRSLMKLQENIHWALGRDRKLASIGVYDLATVGGPGLRYRAADWNSDRFVPLGFDLRDPAAALTPREIVARHPKGMAFGWLLEGAAAVPLLCDATGQVLALIPLINSEATKVTATSRELFVDCTGLDDAQVDRALAIIVTSLVESSPGAWIESVTIDYPSGPRVTPRLAAQAVSLDPSAASALIGIEATPTEVAALLGRMRHDATVDGARVQVAVAPYRADVIHPRDLVEDLAIAYGYDRIPDELVTAATYGDADPRERLAGQLRETLAGLGFLEVMTLPLTNEQTSFSTCQLPDHGVHVTLAHPISVDQTMVRVSTIPGLLETLAVNLGHGYPQRIFEVGLCARQDERQEAGAGEVLVASAALAGDGLGYADIRAVADASLHEWWPGAAIEYRPSAFGTFIPGRGGEIWSGGRCIGWLGEVHPAVLERFRIIHPVAVMELLPER